MRWGDRPNKIINLVLDLILIQHDEKRTNEIFKIYIPVVLCTSSYELMVMVCVIIFTVRVNRLNYFFPHALIIETLHKDHLA